MAREDFKPGNMLYPLPAVLVSCQRPGEKPNALTIAWAGTICSDPAMVSISIRPSRYSYDIINETKEFVINLVNDDLVFAADYCGVKSGKDVDKFKEMKLTPVEINGVSCPGIDESPVCIGCKVVEVKKLGTHDMFIANVVSVSANKKYMDEKGKFELNSSGLMVYSHGDYFTLGESLGSFGYSVRKNSGKNSGESTNKSANNNASDKASRNANKNTSKSANISVSKSTSINVRKNTSKNVSDKSGKNLGKNPGKNSGKNFGKSIRKNKYNK